MVRERRKKMSCDGEGLRGRRGGQGREMQRVSVEKIRTRREKKMHREQKQMEEEVC